MGAGYPPRCAGSRGRSVGEGDGRVGLGAQGFEQVVKGADIGLELGGGGGDFVEGMGIASADRRQAAGAPARGGALVLERAVAAVEAFDAVEEVHRAGWNAEARVARGMGEEHQGAAGVAEFAEAAGVGDAGAQFVEAVDEDVAEFGGDFDAGENEDVGRFVEHPDALGGPDHVVFGEDDAVEAAFGGAGDEVVREHVAVGRPDGRVDVHVDEHAGRFAGRRDSGKSGTRRVYDPRVASHDAGTVEIVAEPVADERQLDGRRHLELVGEDAAGRIEASVRMVISREGELEECDLMLANPDGEAAVTFDGETEVVETEPLSLRAAGGEMEIEVEQQNDGAFAVRIRGAEALP